MYAESPTVSKLEDAAARALASCDRDMGRLLESSGVASPPEDWDWGYDSLLDAPPAGADDNESERPSLVERFAGGLTPFSDEELEAAKEPHPHAFQDDECGLFPVGEVSVVASPGRAGKTFATVGLGVAYVLGIQVVGLTPQPDRSVLIYSAEDDRSQYARKLLAHCSRLGVKDAAAIRSRVIVPDLQLDGMEPFQTLVTVADRAPIESPVVNAAIAAVRPLMDQPTPPGLLIFETASTLSEAEEDNRAFRILIRALRRIARELGVAVVLVHHTSQAASSNLAELNLSVTDIRGGTSLAYNSRQNLLLVNLGSDAKPFPDGDARTLLRGMLAPDAPGRVSVLVTLDSSKGMDPDPVLLRWNSTPYGIAVSVDPGPLSLRGVSWEQLIQRIRAQRVEHRQAVKDGAKADKVEQVVDLVRAISADGQHPTAKRVSVAAGHNPGWAAPYLAVAVQDGELVCRQEKVPRTQGMTAVYRPSDWLEGRP